MKHKSKLVDQKNPAPSSQRVWSMLLILLVSVTNTPLHAQSSSADVMPLLEGYEWTLEPKAFLCLGDGTDSALREIASDPELPSYYRLRALSALSLFPNDQTANLLERTIAGSSSDSSQVRRALRAYSDGFRNEPERVTTVTRNLLNTSTNRHIRAAAAETLARYKTQSATEALQEYLDTDLSSLERQRIERVMNQTSINDTDGIQHRTTDALLKSSKIECK